MTSEYLSNIELYYTPPFYINEKNVEISGDEAKHILKVMRHKIGDNIFVTNGEGKIYETKIVEIQKEKISSFIIKELYYKNKYENIFFVLPKLKNPSRFEFALEKSVELGITNFIIYNAENSLVKGDKLERANKILISAMKQSLHSFLPKIELINKLSEIKKYKGKHFLFEQKGYRKLSEIKIGNEKHYFVFGPEGGLTGNEKSLFSEEEKLILNDSRLRAETAVVSVAAIISFI